LEVKPGYKLTETGVIPDEWDVATVGSLASFASGLGISVASLQEESADNPVPVYGGNGVAGYTRRAMLTKPSVVIGRVGQKCGEVHATAGPAWVTDNALYPSKLRRPLDIEFLALALQRAGLNDLKNRNDLPLVTQSILHSVRLPWPVEVREQHAIAEAVGDAATLLAGLDRLIAKRRDLKQAAMEQLLTGQLRLPGFADEWEELNVGRDSVLKARIGWQGLTTAEYLAAGDYHLVTGTDFVGGQVDWARCCFVDRSRYLLDRNIQLAPNDVLLTKDGTIGKAAFVDTLPRPATLNSGVFVIRPRARAYAPKYLYFVLTSRIFDAFLARLQAGSTITHLYQKDFVAFSFRAPHVLEQTAIAELLSDMDAELAALETRREKTRALRQAMIQQLLTGKARLV
jgi:type I restriction enzyme, S subunit